MIEIKDEPVRMRKDFHRFPELGFKEYWTAEKVAEYMKNLGLEVQTGIRGTGVVGLLRGKEAAAGTGNKSLSGCIADEWICFRK